MVGLFQFGLILGHIKHILVDELLSKIGKPTAAPISMCLSAKSLLIDFEFAMNGLSAVISIFPSVLAFAPTF